MTKLYRVKEEAVKPDGFSTSKLLNLRRVTGTGYLWVHVEGRIYRSIATGQLAMWFSYEVELVD